MKKLITMLCLIAVITGCEKTEEDSYQALKVTVKYSYSSNPSFGKKLSNDAFAYLYKDTGKEVDNDKSTISILFDTTLTYKDGTSSAAPIRSSQKSESVFKNIPDGNYLLWVGHKSASSDYKTSSTKITINSKDDIITKNVVLDMDKKSGYQSWQEE